MVRFDRPCKTVAGAVGYFREHLRIGDYLSEQGATEMTWFGSGAERLGLLGPCRLEEFESVCQGKDPRTGQPLLVRDKSGRRICFFGQISAPKDVSIALLVGGDERIAEWWASAVHETLLEIEATAAARVRRGGQMTDRPTGNIVAAIVTHETSRALDPQLHTHLCIMNATWDETEGRWKGLQPDGFYRHQAFFREVCHNHLARAMIAGGYGIEPAPRGGFRIRGLPAELRELFSKRRREILAAAAREGARHQDSLQAIAGRTRADKVKTSAAHLRAGWRAEAGDHLDSLLRLVGNASSVRTVSPDISHEAVAVASARRHVYERQSVVSERELLREALMAGRGRVALAGLRRELELAAAAGHVIREGGNLISPEALEAETECLRIARDGREACKPWGPGPPKSILSDDQHAAARQLAQSRDRISILEGDAGTGKTTVLRSLADAARTSGLKVFGFAPSSGAVEVLRRELTSDSDTLQQLLVNGALQRSVAGGALIIDEAGLVSIRQLRDLLRLAELHSCRVLLVGDPKQHASVEAGDALRALRRYSGLPAVRLTRIRRQRDPRYRAAVAALARGDVARAFRLFDRLGAVRVMPIASLHREAAASYLGSLAAGNTCLAVSPVWSEIHAFTAELRQQLRSAGRLGDEQRTLAVVETHHWTREQLRRTESYAAGDVITFHAYAGGFRPDDSVTVREVGDRGLLVETGEGLRRFLNPLLLRDVDVGHPRSIEVSAGDRLLLRGNFPSTGLRNGDIVTVKGVRPDDTIDLADGRTIPPAFRHFTHGYAVTSHASQGKTVDHGILILGPLGIQSANLQQAYVSNSRFRERQLIFTSDREAALEAMERRPDRLLALEALPAPKGSRRSPRNQPAIAQPLARTGSSFR